jgi:hypothetical protein
VCVFGGGTQNSKRVPLSMSHLDWIGLDWIGLDWIVLGCLTLQPRRRTLKFRSNMLPPFSRWYLSRVKELAVP